MSEFVVNGNAFAWNHCKIVALPGKFTKCWWFLKHAPAAFKTAENCKYDKSATHVRHKFVISICRPECLLYYHPHLSSTLLHDAGKKNCHRTRSTKTQIHINIAFYEWKSFHLFIGFRIFGGVSGAKVEKYRIAIDITIFIMPTTKYGEVDEEKKK